MCGIFGCILKKGRAAPLIREALKRLEYRGYDSAGIATIHGGKLYVKKDAGKIDEIHRRLDLDDMPGRIGIGHTRWATHGAPSQENAHPHGDCKWEVAVVHNGIIENFDELKKELMERGHEFKSKTDTEVIPHLIEEGLKNGLNLEEAVIEAVRRLEGSFAIAVISTKEPDKIVCARKESPLVVGIGEDGMYCASDVPAFLPITRRMVVLDDWEVAVLTEDSYKVVNALTEEEVIKEERHVDWSPELAMKGGYLSLIHI